MIRVLVMVLALGACLSASGANEPKRSADATKRASSKKAPASESRFDLSTEDLPARERWKHSISAGVSLYRFDYREDFPPPGKSEEKGVLPGFRFGYETEPGDSFFLNPAVEFTSASTTYDGSLQNAQGARGEPYRATTKNTFLDMSFKAGWTFGKGTATQLRPYAGLGARFWGRGAGEYNEEERVISYREEYQWFYLPIGARLQYQVNDRWELGLDGSLRAMFGGKMKVKMSQFHEGVEDPRVDLGSELGYRLELPVACGVSKSVRLVLAPWYQYSAIGESNSVEIRKGGRGTGSAIMEPASRTHEYGSSMNAVFQL